VIDSDFVIKGDPVELTEARIVGVVLGDADADLIDVEVLLIVEDPVVVKVFMRDPDAIGVFVDVFDTIDDAVAVEDPVIVLVAGELRVCVLDPVPDFDEPGVGVCVCVC
jgi:hypothetical protein